MSGGGAVAAAAAELKQKLLAAAADHLEAALGDLELVDGRVSVLGSPRRGVALSELAAGGHERFNASASFDPARTVYPYATHVCVVEVDRETGQSGSSAASSLRIAAGSSIHSIVEGQGRGAIAQGIGGALYESLVYDAEGQLVTASLMDYLVPTAMELSRVEIDHLEIPSPDLRTARKGLARAARWGLPRRSPTRSPTRWGWS